MKDNEDQAWRCPTCGSASWQPPAVQVMAHFCGPKSMKRTVMVKDHEQGVAQPR